MVTDLVDDYAQLGSIRVAGTFLVRALYVDAGFHFSLCPWSGVRPVRRFENQRILGGNCLQYGDT